MANTVVESPNFMSNWVFLCCLTIVFTTYLMSTGWKQKDNYLRGRVRERVKNHCSRYSNDQTCWRV